MANIQPHKKSKPHEASIKNCQRKCTTEENLNLKAENEEVKCHDCEIMPPSPVASLLSPSDFVIPMESVKVEFNTNEDLNSDCGNDDPDWEPHVYDSLSRNTKSLISLRGRPKHWEECISTYVVESSEGPVRLKHAQLQILRCDDAMVKDDVRSVRRRDRLERLMSYRKTYKHLREKAKRRQQSQQKRLQEAVAKKPVGRPPKYIVPIPPGKEEICHFPRCGYMSGDADQLSGHYRGKHLKERHPFRCTYPGCGKCYSEFRRLVVHRAAHQGYFPFTCTECERKFQRKEAYTHHMLLKHTENPPKFGCHLCPRTYPTEKSCRHHVKIVHGPKTFKCTLDNCDRSFSTKGNLQSHQQNAHSDKFPQRRRESLMCAECGFTVQGKYAFKKHQLKHQGIVPEKPFTCSYEGCRYRAEKLNVLQKHIVAVHETTEKKFACTKCDGIYKSKASLNSHDLRRHSEAGRRMVYCPTCGVALTSEFVLKNHIAIRHTTGNKNDFLCPRCQMGFPTNKYLRRHQLKYPNCQPKEPGPKAVSCEICEKSCSNKAGLRRHMHLVHNPELRPWPCEKCGKDFPIKMYLMRHQRESKSCIRRDKTKTEEPMETSTSRVSTTSPLILPTKSMPNLKMKRSMETLQTKVQTRLGPTNYRVVTPISTTPVLHPSSNFEAISLADSGYEPQINITPTTPQIQGFYYTLSGVNYTSSHI